MSQEKSISELKLEISGYYVKELQKELGWLKGLVVYPIKEEIKNIIVNEKVLPDKFNEIKEFGLWKDIINFVTPSIAERIFNFIKEKKEEIAKRNTRDELIALKNEIIGKLEEKSDDGSKTETEGKEGNGENGGGSNGENQGEDQGETASKKKKRISSAAYGVVVGTGGAVAVKYGQKGYLNMKRNNEIRKVAESLSSKEIKSTVSSIIESAEKQKKALASTGQLSRKQIANVEKQISHIKGILNSGDLTDEGIQAFMARQRFGDRMPTEMLEKMGHNRQNIQKLEKIAGEVANIDNVDELKKLLNERGIKNLDDSFIKLLAETNDAEKIKGITRIAGNAGKAKQIAKMLGGAMCLDAAFFGVDIWMYLESKKHAELIEKVNKERASNKYTQAARQLAIGASSFLAEILIACTAIGTAGGGPVGALVGMAVGLVMAAASIGVDTLYFDVKDFYLQNKEDFIREKKSQIMQAVLVGLYNKKHGNTSINEHICEFFNGPKKSRRIKNTDDALWAAIFLDEIENGKYKGDSELYTYIQSGKNLKDYMDSIEDEEKKTAFKTSREGINKEIEKRKKFTNSKESNIIDNINKFKGMKTLNDVLVHSRVYAHISGENKRDTTKDYDTNLQSYKKEFFKDVDQEKLKKLEEIKSSNKDLFDEIIASTDEDSLINTDDTIPEGWENMKNEYQKFKSYVKVIAKYKEWMEITQSNEEKIKLSIPNLCQQNQYIENLLINDLNQNTSLTPSFEGKEGAILRFKYGDERNGTLEVSDDPLYNVLYKVGKDLFGYTGNNNPSELMGFYDENLGNTHGIYYSSKWKVNNDRRIDSGIVDEGMKGPFNSQEEIDKYVEQFIKTNLDWGNLKKRTIDTQAENIDEQLQREFESKIRETMKNELSYRLKSNVDAVKKEIMTFVQNCYKENASDNHKLGYITLPYYLIIKAKKAGLGDLQKALFKRRTKEGKMEICRLPYDTYNIAIPFDNDKVILSYISSYRKLTDEKQESPEGIYTDEEKFFIDRVERAHKLVEDLRSCEGIGIFQKEDELDLPTEIEHLISDKYNEWQRFKRNLLVRAPEYVSTNTIQQYEDFAQYFENLYRGILLMLTTFKVSNDLDGYSLYSSALAKGGQVYFDENGKLREDTELEFIDNKIIRKFYNEQIQKQKVKVGDKNMTIKELWAIPPLNENSEIIKQEYDEKKALALQASNTILTVLLENSMLTKDNQGNIKIINIGGNFQSNMKKAVTDLKNETEATITKRLDALRIPPRSIDNDKIEKNAAKEQTIKELTQQERNATSQAIDLTARIKDTCEDIDWQGKRGTIEYDPENKILKSRNHEIKVRIDENNGKYKFYTPTLRIGFENMSDFFWMANFRNRVLYENETYKHNMPISFANDPEKPLNTKTFLRGNTTLVERDILIKNCSICNDDGNMKILTSRLNNELNIKNDNGLKYEGKKVVM